MKRAAVFAVVFTVLTGCGQGSGELIPEAPDYADETMWFTAGDTQNSGADIFYIVSTWEEDWRDSTGRVSHYADVWNPKHRERMAREMRGVAEYMAPGNRFCAPYYRHATIDAYLTASEDTIYARTRLAMKDVCDAFDYFQSHRDTTRPFVIAGFSQGGQAVVELLKHMSDATYNQLAAAYVLGYKVTAEDLSQTTHIVPAAEAGDTGVTICYNTIKDVKYVNLIIADTQIAINPVNWRTDATPATLHDTITVTLDPTYKVLIVNGYSGSEYKPYKNFINVGDIHSCEPWLYSDCLKENINLRAANKRIQSLNPANN